MIPNLKWITCKWANIWNIHWAKRLTTWYAEIWLAIAPLTMIELCPYIFCKLAKPIIIILRKFVWHSFEVWSVSSYIFHANFTYFSYELLKNFLYNSCVVHMKFLWSYYEIYVKSLWISYAIFYYNSVILDSCEWAFSFIISYSSIALN